MSHSFYFLAASWLAAQAVQPIPVQGRPAVTVEAAPSGYSEVDANGQGDGWRPQRRNLFTRVQGWFEGIFGRGRGSQPQMQPGGMNGGTINGGNGVIIQQQPIPAINTNEPPLAVPGKVSALGTQAGISQAAHQSGRGHLDLPVGEKFRDKVGHEADYSWITGQLYRIDGSSGGLWLVRYATAEMQDQYGGTVVLAPAVQMSNYRDGDLVSVRGEVLNGGRNSEQIAAPVYRASDVSLVERGD